jgi:hypothetical protein
MTGYYVWTCRPPGRCSGREMNRDAELGRQAHMMIRIAVVLPGPGAAPESSSVYADSLGGGVGCCDD